MSTIRKFRPDIEVLRAIAVLAVIISHSKLGLESGFIGVDIFFVISGFLITRHLFEEVKKNGTISLKNFYSRRVLRILPASMFVLFVTLVSSFIWLSPLQIINYGWDSLLASFSGVNYRLAASGTDYFQSTSTPSPFQHFWSLAVEEQFYLIWPFFIYLIARILVRKQKILSNFIALSDEQKSLLQSDSEILKPEYSFNNFNLFKYGTTLILFVIISVSLYLSYTITKESQMWAYFGLHTRAWQLSIGALIAFHLGFFAKIPEKIASILSWVGLSGLVLGFILINESTSYPGLWALLPTLSTALIVIAGTHLTKFSVESVFNRKYTRGLAKISYSLYLIHWPIFVIFFYQFGDKIKFYDRIGLIIFCIMLSILSYFLIENPLRFNKTIKSSAKKTFAFGLCMVLITGGISGITIIIKDQISNYAKADLVISGSEKILNEKIKNSINLNILPSNLVLPIDKVLKDKPQIGCILPKIDLVAKNTDDCKLGNKNSNKTIVLLGDSHAFQWTENILEFANKNNFKLLTYTKSGCPLLEIKKEYTECTIWREKSLVEIEKIHPDYIIYSNIQYQDSTSLLYSDFVDKLNKISNNVVSIIDTPKPVDGNFIPECLSKNSSNIQKCNLKIPQAILGKKQRDVEIEIAKQKGVHIIDTLNWFCYDSICPTIIDNVVVYQDDSHISNTYAKYLSNLMEQKLEPILTK